MATQIWPTCDPGHPSMHGETVFNYEPGGGRTWLGKLSPSTMGEVLREKDRLLSSLTGLKLSSGVRYISHIAPYQILFTKSRLLIADRCTGINSQMPRIDLFCKLVGPLAISLIDGVSTRAAIITAFRMSIAPVVAESSLPEYCTRRRQKEKRQFVTSLPVHERQRQEH